MVACIIKANMDKLKIKEIINLSKDKRAESTSRQFI